MGIPRLTQNASRSSRNRLSRMNTSRKPVPPVRSIRRSCESMISPTFCQTVMEMPGGQRRLRARGVLLHAVGDVQRILVAGAEDGEQHGRREVEAGRLVGFGEAVHDRGDIAQYEAGAVRPRQQRQGFVLVAAIRLSDGAQQDLAGVAAHRAARQVERRVPHGGGHVVERQTVPAEHRFRHFNRYLVGARAGHLDQRYVGKRGQLVAHALGDLLQHELVGVARHGQVHHLCAGDELADDRLLGLFGKGIDGVDPALDVIQHAANVGAELELDHDAAHALRRRRDDLLDAVDAVDRLLDPHAHGLLDLFRGGPQVGHLDVDAVEGDLGHHLGRHVDGGDQPADDEQPHQQVGGDRIPGEPVDNHWLWNCVQSARRSFSLWRIRRRGGQTTES